MSINARLAEMKRAIKWYLTRHEALILTYHSILPTGTPLFPIAHHLDETQFEAQMQYLASNGFNCVSLTKLAEYIDAGKIPKHTIAVTFDDGFYNNYSVALPIIEHHKIPACIFITTDLIDSKELLWPEQIAIALATAQTPCVRINNNFLHISTAEERTATYQNIAKIFSSLTPEQIQVQLNSLFAQLNLSKEDLYAHELYNTLKSLSWNNVVELQGSDLIEIGSHTLSHRRLIYLSKEAANEEIKNSKAVIEKQVGKCFSFAYPHGRTGIDFDSDNTNMAIQADYKIIVTTDPATVNKHSQVLNLPRLSIVNNRELDSFNYMMKGGAAFLNRRISPKAITRGVLHGTIH